MRQFGALQKGHAMTKLIDCLICLTVLLVAAYMWPVSKALTFVVVGILYGLLMWRIIGNAQREKKTRQ